MLGTKPFKRYSLFEKLIKVETFLQLVESKNILISDQNGVFNNEKKKMIITK